MQIKFLSIIVYVFALAFILGNAACGFVKFGETSAAVSNSAEANVEKPIMPVNTNAANQSTPNASAPQISAKSIVGKYSYDDHGKGKSGDLKYLEIESKGGNKVGLSLDAYNFHPVGGEETFDEGTAEGDGQLRGSVIRTNLIADEAEKSNCRVTLVFAGKNQVTVKSANCSMRILPDGVYKREKKSKEDVDGSLGDVPKKDSQNTPSGENKPYVEYDSDHTAQALKNLMPTKAERRNCSDIETFKGQIVKVEQPSVESYEFTAATANGKRQKFYFYGADGIEIADSDAVISKGNTVTVKFVYCGSGSFASPLEITKK